MTVRIKLVCVEGHETESSTELGPYREAKEAGRIVCSRCNAPIEQDFILSLLDGNETDWTPEAFGRLRDWLEDGDGPSEFYYVRPQPKLN